MTRSTNMEHVAHLQRMANESWIGSPERAALDAAIAVLSAPQPPAEPTNRAESSSKLVDGQPPAEAKSVAPAPGDLLPCPFCGAPAERIDFGPGDAENEGGSCIACTRCQSSGPVEFGRKENFVANWNRRTAPPSAPVEVELLCQVYADAYHHGHHATVEGGYIDVLPVDRDTFWREQVEENYTEALAQQPAAVDGAMVEAVRHRVGCHDGLDITPAQVRSVLKHWRIESLAAQQGGDS